MSYVVWTRRCRKCKGQLYLEESEDSTCVVCIQCGHSEKIANQELATLLSAIHPSARKDLSQV